MQRLIDIIRQATDALPAPDELTTGSEPVTARDWAALFAAIADFFKAILPILIPLVTKTKPE